MSTPDFERARQYALERLERELPASLTYHCLAHTQDDVVPAVERLAALGARGPLVPGESPMGLDWQAASHPFQSNPSVDSRQV